jgi:hypothetical protein
VIVDFARRDHDEDFGQRKLPGVLLMSKRRC